MSATAPFTGSPTIHDWLMAGQLALAQSTGNAAQFANYLPAWAAPTNVVTLQGAYPNVFTVVSFSSTALVSVAGLGTNLDWVLPGIISKFIAQTMPTPAPGTAPFYFQDFIDQMYSLLLPQITGSSVVFIGHGRGGAVALLAAFWAAANAVNVRGIYTLGAPHITQGMVGGSLGNSFYHLENVGDPVTSLLPAVYTTVNNLPHDLPSFPDLQPGDRAGILTSLDSNGNLYSGNQELLTSTALATLDAGDITPQFPSEYVRRLLQSGATTAALQPGANGYAQPWLLWNQLQTPVFAPNQYAKLFAAKLQEDRSQALCDMQCADQAAAKLITTVP